MNDPSPTRRGARSRLIGGALLLGVVLVAVWTLPLEAWLDAAAGWIAANPWQGRSLYFTGFVVGTVLLVPGSLLLMIGGYLFGVNEGLALTLAGIAAGSGLACLLGRGIARDFVEAQVTDSPRLAALDAALTENGLFVAILTRVSLLLPYNLLNYAFGLTRIRFGTFVLGTTVGMVPAATMYVYLGSIAQDIEQLVAGEVDTGWQGQLLLAAGLVAIVVTVIVIHRTATRELKRRIGEA